MRFSALRRVIPAALVLPALLACNEEPDFGFGDWDAAEETDTATLYTADRVEHQGLPSAYDILNTRAIRIEDPGATGAWDFALTGGDGSGPLTLTPLGAFFDVASSAGLTTVEAESFELLDRAPADDDAYVTDDTVALDAGRLYVVRSRTGGGCVNFAKLEPLEIDQEAGTLTFQVTRNPNCNDTDLVPPED